MTLQMSSTLYYFHIVLSLLFGMYVCLFLFLVIFIISGYVIPGYKVWNLRFPLFFKKS